MRLIFFLAFLCSWISYAQNFQMSNKDVNNKIYEIRSNSILVDSLTYVDSTCTYFYDYTNILFNGYAIYRFENKIRFNFFKDGKYTGEEWIFSNTNIYNYDSLVNNLQEFRVVCDTNSNFTVVTTYYDFYTYKIYEYYVAERKSCVEVNRLKPKPFDMIFGGSPEFYYQSFYKNGNIKYTTNGYQSEIHESIFYYENGNIESYHKENKNHEKGIKKSFDENGKCVYRMKIRNNKVRGLYFISKGKIYPSFYVRHKTKKQFKKKSLN